MLQICCSLQANDYDSERAAFSKIGLKYVLVVGVVCSNPTQIVLLQSLINNTSCFFMVNNCKYFSERSEAY